MKKLIVVSEESDSEKEGLVAEFLSMQYNYGLYDFDAEKILNDLEELYQVRVNSIEIPYYHLVDENGGTIKVEFTEEYYQ